MQWFKESLAADLAIILTTMIMILMMKWINESPAADSAIIIVITMKLVMIIIIMTKWIKESLAADLAAARCMLLCLWCGLLNE